LGRRTSRRAELEALRSGSRRSLCTGRRRPTRLGLEDARASFEGGSDHVVFIEKGIPAVLFWHFTDFAYHTSLDRLDHLDLEEMHRTGAAILCTALALADAQQPISIVT